MSLLPKSALVQRGGTCVDTDLERAAQQSLKVYGCWGLSAHAAEVGRKVDLLQQTPHLPHTKLRYTTIGALLEAGFALDRTGDAPHITIWFPGTHSLGYWIHLVDKTFERPVLRVDVEAGYV